MVEDLGVLRHRRCALLVGSRSAATAGQVMGAFAVAFGVLALGGSATTLSAVVTAQAVALVGFLLVGGSLADRFPRNGVLAAGDLLAAAGWAATGIVLLGGSTSPLILAICMAAAGAGAGLASPVVVGVVPEVAPADRLQAMNGLIRLGMNLARIVGAVLAGLAVPLIGSGATLLICGGCYLAGGTAALLLPAVGSAGARDRSGFLGNVLEGWREFASRRWLWMNVLMAAAVMAGFHAYSGLLGPLVAHQFLGGPLAWSMLLSAYAVGMIVGVTVAMRIRPSRPLLVVALSALLLVLPFWLVALPLPLPVLMAGAFLAGIGLDVFGVLWHSTLQRRIPAAVLSRVSAYDQLGSFVAGPIAVAVAGPLAVTVGARPALQLFAGLATAVVLLVLAMPSARAEH